MSCSSDLIWSALFWLELVDLVTLYDQSSNGVVDSQWVIIGFFYGSQAQCDSGSVCKYAFGEDKALPIKVGLISFQIRT